MLILPCLYVASRLRRMLHLPELFLFALVFLVVGLAAEAIFFTTMLNTEAARVVAWIAGAIGFVATVGSLRDVRFRAELKQPDSWAPFLATAAGGFAFIAMFCMSLPEDASSVAFAEIWLWRFPNDNVLPALLAQHIAAHVPPKPFVGGWLSSDRPPLQAGFELLLTAFTPFVNDVEARYQALCMLLQASAFGMLFTLCRLCGCAGLRATAVVFLSWLSGFFLINTEFVWPKLLAAAFVAVAIAICLAPGLVTVQRAIAVGIATGLGLLAHGGIVFTIPALIVAFIVIQRRLALRPLALAFAVIVVLNAPWIWYQRAYDPPGDRLLKWHLAGQGLVEPTNRAFLPTLYHAYADVPLHTIIGYKISNLETLLGLTLGDIPRRSREFFYVGDALVALMPCFVGALFSSTSKQRRLRMASRFAWVSIASLLFWALALYLPDGDVLHAGSYLTILLMFAAGGIVAVEWPVLFVAVAAVQAYDFRNVWLNSLDFASVVTPSGFFAFFILAVIAAGCCAATARCLFTINGTMATALKDGDKLRLSTYNLQRRLTANWLSMGIFVLVAFLIPAAVVLSFRAAAGSASPVAVTAALVAPVTRTPLPPLTKIVRHAGRATVSLDVVMINGNSTVVAGLKTRRTIRVAAADKVSFIGWAVDPAVRAPAAGVVVRIGTRDERAGYGFYRKDVAAAFGSPSLAPVGFNGRVNVRDLRPGANDVSLIVVANDRKSYYVNTSDVVIDRR